MSVQASTPRPQQLVRSFQVLAKPAGSRCNLDCAYCYYLHKDRLLAGGATRRMADGLLEGFLRQSIDGQDAETVVFTWHGGEPTLLGLDFYREVVRLQRVHAGTRRIENDLQTNGLRLDDAWCAFLKEHGFLVGLSIDGPRDLHDRFRTGRGGEPTFDRVVAAARLLRRHGVPFNTLTFVHGVNARHPEEVYRFLTEDLGSTRLHGKQRKQKGDIAECHEDSAQTLRPERLGAS